MRRSPPRARPLLAALAMLAMVAGGCTSDVGVAPAMQPRVVVHAVLNAGLGEQAVLVERTVAGERCLAYAVYDPQRGGAPTCTSDITNPIVVSGGDPISGATVVVYAPSGDSAVAVEDAARRADGTGAGVYRFVNASVDATRPLGPGASLPLVPGARYRLRVTTALGTARGETAMPGGTAAALDAPRVEYNVDRDSLPPWTARAPGAARYLLTLDQTASRSSVVLGEATTAQLWRRAIRAEKWGPTGQIGLVDLLAYPGLPATLTLMAVDSNYVRWSDGQGEVDPFSSESPSSSITGGVGVFASVVPLAAARLDVVANVDSPFEGTFTSASGSSHDLVQFTLYQTVAAGDVTLSGSFTRADGGGGWVLGTRQGGSVDLTFMSQSTPGVAESFTGTLVGRTYVGTYRRGGRVGEASFTRAP